MMIPLLALAVSLAAPSEFAQLRKTWGLQIADPARPGLWKARGRDSDPRVLVRVDTTAAGDILRSEWSAEKGVQEVDLPDDRFWVILDGFAQGREWIETDPDALPAKVFLTPVTELAQGFRCTACRPSLVAATWSPHGGTRLLVGRSTAPQGTPRLALSETVSEEGILSLVSQQGLSIETKNPCREGKGFCALDLAGPKGERWRLSRRDGSSPWRLAEATFPGNAWWNPEWDWDSPPDRVSARIPLGTRKLAQRRNRCRRRSPVAPDRTDPFPERRGMELPSHPRARHQRTP